MDHIKKTAEAALSGLTTSSKRLPDATTMPGRWVAALFAKLQARYLHKWTSAIEGIEDLVSAEWREQLAGLSGEQLKAGLENWKEAWPPSAPEFRDACLGKTGGKNEFGLDYVPEYYREQPKVDRSHMLSSDQRDEQRERNRVYIEMLKSALKGEA